MPTAQQYQQLIASNPNVRRFLDTVGWAEGANYNVGFGGRKITDLSWHPYPQRAFRIGNKTTSAAGKYQFQRGTWDSEARELGLKDFSPQSQDIAALDLIYKRNALNDVINGNVASAVNKLKPEWESFVVRPLNSIVAKFNGSTGGVTSTDNLRKSHSVPDSLSGITRKSHTAPTLPQLPNGNQNFMASNTRYLIAFAILAIIFIFAFN